MAFTQSLVTETVLGNVRAIVYNVTPDAAAGTITTQDDVSIKWAQVSIKSAATIATNATTFLGVFTENAGDTGTAIAGTLAMTSVVANDVYRVVVYK